MHVEVIDTADRLFRFAPEWSAFVSAQPNNTPFQLPEWLMTWWSHFGSGSLRVLVFRQAECVGVFPSFLHEWNGARQVTLIGSGMTDYLDPVFDTAYEQEILNCLAQQFACLSDWDRCDWQDLSHRTPLRTLPRDYMCVHYREEVPCSEVPLPETFDAYWEQRPRHLRRNIRRYAQKASELGRLDFQVTQDAKPEIVEALVLLHRARWNLKGEPGMIESNHSSRFLFEIARLFAERNMLRLFTLRLEGQIAAVILAFAYKGKMYGYLTGSSPLYRQFSVASILLHEALRHCCAENFRAWNFCRGDEAYKTDWGAEAIRRCRVVLQHIRS